MEYELAIAKDQVLVRFTYDSGKVRDFTLYDLRRQRTEIEKRIAKGEDLSNDLATLTDQIAAVEALVSGFPDVVTPLDLDE